MISVDEKPGIQAIERDGATLPMQPGKVERQEYNYKRHATQVLTGNIDIATGELIAPSITDNRKEKDFVTHIDTIIQTDPEGKFIFLLDQLNKSESLVRYVATAIGDTQDLGKKGKTDMESRQAYLSHPTHRIYFIYTPKHCSWLNPIEVWFSVLNSHVLKRGNFTSKADLKQKISNYITYYNQHLAKPYKWSIITETAIEDLIAKVKTNAVIPAIVRG